MAAGATVNLKLLIQATNKASKQVEELQRGINKLARSSEQLGKRSAKGSRTGQKAMQEWNATTDQFIKKTEKAKKATDGFATAGLSLLGVAASLGAATFFPIKSATDFEAALSKVVAVTDGAVDQFNELKATASELGRTTKFTATEAAQGMVFLGQAGFDAGEVLSGIGPSLQLAVAAGVDLATAADIATNVVSAMRLEVNELSIAVDILANTTASSNTNLLQLADALKYAGPLAAASNVRLEEVAAVMGVLGNNGIQASMAGTAVRGMLRALTAPTAAAQKVLDKLGIVIKTSADGSLDLVGALDQLGAASLSAADANALFGRFAAAGALAVSANTKELHALIDSNDAAAGAAMRMAKIMKDNVKGAFIELLSAVDGAKRAFGDPLLKPLRVAIEALTTFTGGVTEVAEKLPVTITLLGTLTITVTVLAAAVGVLALAIGSLNTAFTILAKSGVAVFLGKVKGAILLVDTAVRLTIPTMFTFSGALAAIKAASLFAVGALKKLWAMMATHWVVALVAVIGALVLALAELSARVVRLTNEARSAAAEFERLRAVYSKQVASLKQMEQGSEKAAATARNLREQLLETAKNSEQLSLFATKAAHSINEMTGEVTGGGAALKAFVDEAQRLSDLNMVEQINLLNDQLDRHKGELIDLVTLVNMFKEGWAGIIALIPGGRSWNDVVAEGVDEMKLLTMQIEAANRSYLKMLDNWGEFDPAMTTQEVIEYFRVFKGLSEERATALADVNAEMQREAQMTRDITGEIAGLTLEELRTDIALTTKEVNILGDAYENISQRSKEAAQALSKIPEGQRKNATAQKAAVEQTLKDRAVANKTLTAREEQLNQKLLGLKKDLAAETAKQYDKDLEALKRSKELGYTVEWQYNNALADLNLKRAKAEKANVVELQDAIMKIRSASQTELPVAATVAKDIEAADEKIDSSSKKARDARIKHANEVKQAVIASEREATNIRISLMEDGRAKFEAQRDQELKVLEEDAKKRGIAFTKLAGIEAAIKAKYDRQILDFEAEQTLKIKELKLKSTQETAKEELSLLQDSFNERKISAQTYADESTRIQKKAIDDEIAYLNAALIEAEKKGKENPLVIDLQFRIERLEEKGAKVVEDKPDLTNELKLKEQQRQNQIDQQITSSELDNMNLRNSNLQDMMNKRLELYQQQLDAEYLALEAAHASQEELQAKHDANEKAMAIKKGEELRAIQEQKLQWGLEVAGTAEEAFAQIYEAGGKKQKAFFYLEKAAALAKIVVSTQVAIMKAYEQMGPYLGTAMAALLTVKMVGAMSKVRSSSYAEGGEVQGKSPHRKADNINAWLTAKEWVHPVDAVQYYGKGVMRGIQNKLFPKELFENFRLPTPQLAYAKRGYATGGEVQTNRGLSAGRSKTQPIPQQPTPINIVNVTDPSELDKYLTTSTGQNAILNVLSSRSEMVKRILK